MLDPLRSKSHLWILVKCIGVSGVCLLVKIFIVSPHVKKGRFIFFLSHSTVSQGILSDYLLYKHWCWRERVVYGQCKLHLMGISCAQFVCLSQNNPLGKIWFCWMQCSIAQSLSLYLCRQEGWVCQPGLNTRYTVYLCPLISVRPLLCIMPALLSVSWLIHSAPSESHIILVLLFSNRSSHWVTMPDVNNSLINAHKSLRLPYSITASSRQGRQRCPLLSGYKSEG